MEVNVEAEQMDDKTGALVAPLPVRDIVLLHNTLILDGAQLRHCFRVLDASRSAALHQQGWKPLDASQRERLDAERIGRARHDQTETGWAVGEPNTVSDTAV